MLNGCKTGKGYVLGSRFVGGLAGGFTGSGVKQNDTNSSDVFGSRYVGGIVSVNGSNSQINGMTNTGLVAAFGKTRPTSAASLASMMRLGRQSRPENQSHRAELRQPYVRRQRHRHPPRSTC